MSSKSITSIKKKSLNNVPENKLNKLDKLDNSNKCNSLTEEKFINTINNENLKKIKYASQFMELNYLTNILNDVDNSKILYLNKNVNREESINKFASLLKDFELSIKLEAGIFEFTIVYANSKNIIKNLMPAIYKDKFSEIFLNLDQNSVLQNKTLIKEILSGELEPQQVAFLTPQKMHPEQWKSVIEKEKIKEEKKNSIATTDLYQCFKCKSRKCQMYMLQTRALDEPATKFITCMNCGNVWKK